MNIFWLDLNLQKCAEYHVDKHVVKMILELAQILCTVSHLHGETTPYKPTHQHHPCVVWCNQSTQNWSVLKKLCFYLNQEYKYRYNKLTDHKSWTTIQHLQPPSTLPNTDITPFAQAMPPQYKHLSAIHAYRNYYINDKKHLAKWTNRQPPPWWTTQ